MALNPFFNKGSTMEHMVYEDMVIESIQIYGFEVYYLPRRLRKFDNILGEDTLSIFDLAIPIEVYIENFEGPEGESEIIARFGLELRDNYTFRISKKRWEAEIGKLGVTIVHSRPNEGDLIFIEFGQSQKELYEVKFVEHEKPFYQLDRITTYDLKCEMYQYSNELFRTGIPAIDSISQEVAIDSLLYTMASEAGEDLITENGSLIGSEHWNDETQEKNRYATNADFKEEAGGFVNSWNPNDPFGDGSC
jgi:hypothetical protein